MSAGTIPSISSDRIDAPIIGLYAGKDGGIPQEAVEQMRAALKAAGNPSEIIVYPDVLHGFHGDYRPFYNEAAATDGWGQNAGLV